MICEHLMAMLNTLAADTLNDLQMVAETKRIAQYAIIISWVTYSCMLSYLAFYTEIRMMRTSSFQLASLFIWCGFLWKLHGTMGDNLQEQFLVMPLALFIGLLFLPYLIWMNAEAIVAFKESALSNHLIEVKPSYDTIDTAISQGDLTKALRLADIFLKTTPVSSELWLKIADIHLSAESYAEALTAYEKALPLTTNHPDEQAGVYMRMIDLQWDHLNNNDKARELLQTLKSLNISERSTRFAEARLLAME